MISFNRRYKRKPKKFRNVGNPTFDPKYSLKTNGSIVRQQKGEDDVPKQHTNGLFHSFMPPTQVTSSCREEELVSDSDEIVHRPINKLVNQQQVKFEKYSKFTH